jgi:hypothetical protein
MSDCKKLLSLFLILALSAPLFSQSIFRIHGAIQYQYNQSAANRTLMLRPLPGKYYTDAQGNFDIRFTGQYDVTLIVKDSINGDFEYKIKPEQINSPDPIQIILPGDYRGTYIPDESSDIPTIILTDDGDDKVGDNMEISSILTASKDQFVSTANFNLFTFRFQMRGYDNDYNTVFLNGIPMSDPETGNLVFGEWGGLNDVMRNVTQSYGLQNNSFTIGKPGSNVSIDTRASSQRKTTRISYASSNRSYRNRIMATYNTGKLPSGWSFSFSGSYRWANAGYSPGTLYKGISYFGAVEKEINAKHSIGLTILGSDLLRGRSSANTLESYELADDHYYNPYWGYQNGEVRNSRISGTHKPIGVLHHDWKITKKTSLSTRIGYQTGSESYKRLDWYQARDPRPDYYKYLPSYFTQPTDVAFYDSLYRNDINYRQLNWDYLYTSNKNSFETISNANGVPGNSVSGRRSQYIMEDNKQDISIFNLNSTLESVVTKRWTLQAGFTYQKYKSHNYKVLDDLLGGDYFVDVDKFATIDDPSANPNNDADIPNHIIHEGDIYGYDYDYNVNDVKVWLQNVVTLRRFDFFIGGSLGKNEMWRVGNFRNGKFPFTSLGSSEKLDFVNYSAKAGITYKINGRNYLYVNGGLFSNSNLVENLFISPRTRNDVIKKPENEDIRSIEGGYILTAPDLKIRLTGYLTDFNNGMTMVRFYNDEDRSNDISGFMNNPISNIDKRHTGIEFAGEYALFTGFKISGIAAIGKYYYTSRFNATYYLDSKSEPVVENRTIYSLNYYVPSTPQQAYSLGLSYNGKKYWFININANYARKSYLSPFWDRRTEASVTGLALDDPNRIALIAEEELPAAFTLDLFGGKSFKIKKYYLNLNVGVNNILNNQNIITGGYEQNRLGLDKENSISLDKFPNKYYYAYGINYFCGLTLRF